MSGNCQVELSLNRRKPAPGSPIATWTSPLDGLKNLQPARPQLVTEARRSSATTTAPPANPPHHRKHGALITLVAPRFLVPTSVMLHTITVENAGFELALVQWVRHELPDQQVLDHQINGQIAPRAR